MSLVTWISAKATSARRRHPPPPGCASARRSAPGACWPTSPSTCSRRGATTAPPSTTSRPRPTCPPARSSGTSRPRTRRCSTGPATSRSSSAPCCPRDRPTSPCSCPCARSAAPCWPASSSTTTRVRRVLSLAHTEPALRTRYEGLMAMIESDLTEWAAARLGEPPSALRPRLVAAAVLAARRRGDGHLARVARRRPGERGRPGDRPARRGPHRRGVRRRRSTGRPGPRSRFTP